MSARREKEISPQLLHHAAGARGFEAEPAAVTAAARRSFSLRRSVSPAGAPVVTAAAVNAAGNYKVAVKVELPWHYPAGRLKYESEWMVGQADEEMVADVMARHSCGQLRLTRILNDLSGSK